MDERSTIAYYYIRNPDVVLREEDEDGALLFNPDTNQVKVINNTGLFIWKKCDGTCHIEEIVNAVKNEFDQVPADQVGEEVNIFLDYLLQNGFVGISEG